MLLSLLFTFLHKMGQVVYHYGNVVVFVSLHELLPYDFPLFEGYILFQVL